MEERPASAVDALIDAEDDEAREAHAGDERAARGRIAALHEVIPDSGQEPRSKLLEHLMEHLIMRKQNQVDWLRRARRQP